MLCFPNCKINIGLYVTRRREDGYHDIETIFYPVSVAKPAAGNNMQLHDVLEAVPSLQPDSSAIRLFKSGREVTGSDSDNLVIKAYHLLKERFPSVVKTPDVFLYKNIPMGAGLGGGSADGAFMLRLLNDYHQLQLTTEELATLALQLGSDCPFFIHNTPQFATGRGEQMSDVKLDLSLYSIQLICPYIHVSTARAFSMITPGPATFDLSKLPGQPIEKWKSLITNDFEATVFDLHPTLAEIKRQLYIQGAIYASMSGSGSAIYGIFPKGSKADLKMPIGFESFYLG